MTRAHGTNNASASAHRQLLPAGCLCAHRSYEYLAIARALLSHRSSSAAPRRGRAFNWTPTHHRSSRLAHSLARRLRRSFALSMSSSLAPGAKPQNELSACMPSRPSVRVSDGRQASCSFPFFPYIRTYVVFTTLLHSKPCMAWPLMKACGWPQSTETTCFEQSSY